MPSNDGDPDDRGFDLTRGVTLADFGDATTLLGHVGEEAVLLSRLDDGDVVAVGARCSHYGGPLDQGIVVGDSVRCPWHHACFALRTGEAVDAPALEPVPTWRVERDGDMLRVREKLAAASTPAATRNDSATPEQGTPRVVIVGGGATGFACADMLRRHGFAGSVTLVSGDEDQPYDRPKLSKAFLAGDADREALPLKGPGYFDASCVALRTATEVVAIDTEARTVTDSHGETYRFDHLVLATGAAPVDLPIPGADSAHVHTLRTVADSEAIIAGAQRASRAVVVGSGFIGLETAASLTKRGLTVHVVTRDDLPLGKVLGDPLSRRVRAEHEKHGVVFHTATEITRIDTDSVTLKDGSTIAADLVVIGVGVTPRTGLADAAGLDVDNGVLVDECLRTAVPGIYAGGDIARWTDSRDGRPRRVEHWVVAERHGQHIARNILFGDQPFSDTPFFWSEHFDMKIRYAGHEDGWDQLQIDGDIDAADCAVRYLKDGVTLAIATVGRDREALRWAAAHEAEAGQ